MMPENFDERSIPDFILTMNTQPEKLDHGGDRIGDSFWQDSFVSLGCSDDGSISLFSDDDGDEASSVGERDSMELDDEHCHCQSPPRRRSKSEESCADCGLPPMPMRQPSCPNLISLLMEAHTNDGKGAPRNDGCNDNISNTTVKQPHHSKEACSDNRSPRIGSRAIQRRKQRAAASKTVSQRMVLPPKLPRRKGSNVSSIVA
ncbi:expressed unknown protein [Seminavis robusta]|uniref:Uncharacterized protein n=1 Tax=Seminavis robusta TaxID=568900 RepID=A0A9N8E8Z0_9STRA|nr:expressed unknown protein [Seminavis robusta]|eukprot:Sro787_g202410.1 n/a (203) ;mRNA; r:42528-43136